MSVKQREISETANVVRPYDDQLDKIEKGIGCLAKVMNMRVRKSDLYRFCLDYAFDNAPEFKELLKNAG